MDATTLEMDKSRIRTVMLRVFAGILVAAVLGCAIYYMVSGAFWEKDNLRSMEVLTYLMLVLMSIVISQVITHVVGTRTNYTDCFRVRRSYAYEIRKQSILKYSPIAAAFVCIVKAGTGYVTLSERTHGIATHILFFVVVYFFYTTLIAAATTFLVSLSKPMYILILGAMTWVFAYFEIVHRIPVYLGSWNIGKTVVLGIAIGCLEIYLLKRLKRICSQIELC